MRRPAFTLVELLVVIGIIALLVSILLPALNSARRAAITTKCAAQMREIFNSAQLYAGDNRGYYPPGRCADYNLYGTNYTGGNYAFWYRFLGKYITSNASRTLGTANGPTNVVVWCPAFTAYADPTNKQHTGYGWNMWATFTPSYPAAGTNFPPNLTDGGQAYNTEASVIDKTNTTVANGVSVWPDSAPSKGTWHKATAYTQSSIRALVTDSRVWYTEAQAVAANGLINGQQIDYSPGPQDVGYYNAGASHTEVDYYRHGRYPGQQNKTTYSTTGGKVCYNILYCDGHVATISNDKTEAFRSLRLRFPG